MQRSTRAYFRNEDGTVSQTHVNRKNLDAAGPWVTVHGDELVPTDKVTDLNGWPHTTWRLYNIMAFGAKIGEMYIPEAVDTPRTYKSGDENFDRVFVNSLNGIDPATLTPDEIKTQEQWVNENWDDLNA